MFLFIHIFFISLYIQRQMDDSNHILPQVIANNVTNVQDNQYNENPTAQNCDENDHNKRNLTCFWVIGLCNNYGWIVMLSAAFDIIKRLKGVSVRNGYIQISLAINHYKIFP